MIKINIKKDYFLISMQILQGPASVFVYEHVQKMTNIVKQQTDRPTITFIE